MFNILYELYYFLPVAIIIFYEHISKLVGKDGGIFTVVFEDFGLNFWRRIFVLIPADRPRLDRPRFLVP